MSVDRDRLLHCHCGYDFRQILAPPAIDGEVWQLQLLDLEAEYSLTPSMFETLSTRERAALDFCWRYSVLRATKSVLRRGMTPGMPDPLLDLQQLKALARDFADWPTRFNTTLLNGNGSRTKRFVSRFPALWKRYPNSLPTVLNHLKELQETSKTTPRRGKVIAGLLKGSSSVGIGQLLQSSGCSYDVVLHWVDKGKLPTLTNCTDRGPMGAPSKRRLWFDPVIAREFCELIRSATTVPEAANILGVSTAAVRSLIRGKMLDSIEYGLARWNVRLATASFYRLAETVIADCQTVEQISEDVLAIDHVLTRHNMRSPDLVKRIFQAFRSKEIRLFRLNNATPNWTEIRVSAQDYETWCQNT